MDNSKRTKCEVTWFNKYLETNIKIWKMKNNYFKPKDISIKLNLTVNQINHQWKGFIKVFDVNSGRLK